MTESQYKLIILIFKPALFTLHPRTTWEPKPSIRPINTQTSGKE